MHNVEDYIKRNIDLAVSTCWHDTHEDISLPYSYSVPTVGEKFHSMFYWDTYFTHLALIRLSRFEQIKKNLENFASLADRLGYVPNGNKYRLANRSQPPFLALMVKDMLVFFDDKEWLLRMYNALITESEFWDKKRNTRHGLSHYGGAFDKSLEEEYAHSFCRRTGFVYSEEMQELFASNYYAQAESGWDFNPRFGLCSAEYCAIDLNALLWAQENILSEIAKMLGMEQQVLEWKEKANERAVNIRKYLWNEEMGAFLDRNSETGELGKVFSVASFYPLFVGLATKEEAERTVEKLPLLMHKFGVAPCQEVISKQRYQWASPNGWPCLQVIMAQALKNYGYDELSEEIGQKYLASVEETFKATGKLWEKYNVDTGSCDAVAVYETPEMLGWTAGAYLYFKEK